METLREFLADPARVFRALSMVGASVGGQLLWLTSGPWLALPLMAVFAWLLRRAERV